MLFDQNLNCPANVKQICNCLYVLRLLRPPYKFGFLWFYYIFKCSTFIQMGSKLTVKTIRVLKSLPQFKGLNNKRIIKLHIPNLLNHKDELRHYSLQYVRRISWFWPLCLHILYALVDCIIVVYRHCGLV